MDQKELLQMVKDGLIDIDDAIKLMDAAEVIPPPAALPPLPPKQPSESPSGMKMLKVIIDAVEDGKNSKVRVNIPTSFLKLAMMTGKKMDINGVNIGDKVDLDLIMKAIDDGVLGEIVNIESDDANVVVVIE